MIIVLLSFLPSVKKQKDDLLTPTSTLIILDITKTSFNYLLFDKHPDSFRGSATPT